MTDASLAGHDDPAQVVSHLQRISPEIRGCAILDSSGELLAASGDDGDWRSGGLALLDAADAAGQEPASHAHIATGDGEIFMIRQDGLAAIAVTERFVLSSLMLFDLRAALRGLAGA